MKPDKKPFLTPEESLAALRYAANPSISIAERWHALNDVLIHLTRFADHELHPDGSATVLYQAPNGETTVVTIPPLNSRDDILNFQL